MLWKHLLLACKIGNIYTITLVRSSRDLAFFALFALFACRSELRTARSFALNAPKALLRSKSTAPNMVRKTEAQKESVRQKHKCGL